MILPKGKYNHTGRRHNSGSWVVVVSKIVLPMPCG